MIDRAHIWKVIYNARSNKSHPPTSPNTVPATQNESHDWSASHMKSQLQCAKQHESSSNFTKYCACHAKWISWLTVLTYGRSFTMRGATKVILQLQQIMRLPRKMNLMIDPHHIWNVIYNARSNKSHPPTSPNTAPATQNESHDWSASHMKRHLQCAEQQESSSNFTKYCACHAKWIHDWSASHMKRHLQGAEQLVSSSNLTKYCACHEKWISCWILFTHEMLFTMRGATSVILQPHQILRLPRKMNLMLNSLHTWNAIYNAWSNICHPPTSPNTAPATKNDLPKSETNLLKTAEVSFPMRDGSDHDPTMIREWSDHENANLNPPRRRGYFSRSPEVDSIENYNISRSGYHSKFHRILRLPRKVTLQLHQILRLPRKVTLQLHQILREKWHLNFTYYCYYNH